LTAVVEVLCAFVRHHGRGPEGDSREELEKYRPPTDVQAAVTAVGRVHGLGAGSADIELVEAHLERAQLPDANLTGALLIKAHLTYASLYRAKLGHAELYGADLKWVVLSHAFLVGAYLRSAMLTDADLTDADLTDADLTDADLTDADLTDTILNGADLSKTKGLDQDQLNASKGDERTRLPDGLTQPPHWTDGPSAADADNIREP
jgi:uncharacterized protein YjbI with pentapeptide repeats